MASNAFYPRFAYISNITNAQNAVITFTEDHDYTIGEILSFRVQKAFGMPEINNKHAKVIAKTSNTVTVPIDSTTWGAFTLALLNTEGTTPPVCVPSASGVITDLYTPSVNIEDAFDNKRI